VQRVTRIGLVIIEITTLSVLILATRCANYPDVFIAGNVYFTDADCYARMTRVRLCAKTPGLIVRHHDFENFPQGTTPHTTTPLDYLIPGLSILLEPFTAHAIDLAGALISPTLALIGGWFLWWWSRRMKFRYRWVLLILYAISPILVHGTELGRPDHQSLSMLLVTIAICAEWSLRAEAAGAAASTGSNRWSIVSGVAWGLAIWNSAYESLVLFLLGIVMSALEDRKALLAKSRRTGWLCFVLIIAIALSVERRIPSLSMLHWDPIFKNWARTIGELAHVSPANSIWLRWTGYLLLVAPFLIWMSRGKSEQKTPGFVLVLLVVTYGLTIWQARWGYFFVSIFALALPALLEPIKLRAAVWIAFVLSMFPILRDWDERLWQNEAEIARRAEQRNESAQLRDLALNLQSSELRPFLAPWWLSPSIAYWSGQPGVAGSSHESLNGIADSARFFLSDDWQEGRKILKNHQVTWVFAYDSQRVAQNSRVVLGLALPSHPICWVLDKTPARAPRFLAFSAQNEVCKLYRIAIER
jgi:heme exporter protein D